MMKHLGMGMVCVAALLTGCKDKPPQGQVVATINGQEVTLGELNAEMTAANLPPNVDKKEAQRVLLQRVIERKLLVTAAADQGLDKTTEFISNKRRLDETLVAQAYAKKQLAAVPMPTDAQITQFMTDHPNMFQQREQLVLDQIRFPIPKDITSLKALEGDRSMDAVAAHLAQMGIKFDRGNVGLDSAQAPMALIKLINSTPANEPFVIPDRGMVTVNIVSSRRAVPIDPQQAKSGALSLWRQQKFEEMLAQQVAGLRKTAKITYQDGFAPPAGSKPGAASSSAPAPTN